MYANGGGVQRDDEEAVRLYRLAAEQGHALAQHFLGYLYEEGRGVRRDRVEVGAWYHRAADQGGTDAAEAPDRLR